ncbi:MAG: thioredoxin domain-containing protein [Deltaproteobacteria bacterium]|nr:thioredoxin domain-containing protein [Deltaproteobacteria bacterium]
MTIKVPVVAGVLGMSTLGIVAFLAYRQKHPEELAPAGAAERAVRVPVALGSSPSVGPADAPVTIVEFADFYCRYCAKNVRTRQDILARYPKGVRWVFKQYPRDDLPGRAALAAHAQGKFLAYADRLYELQGKLERADLERVAQVVGLDQARFRAALDSPQGIAEVKADADLARTLKVRGTPGFFINGRRFEGYWPTLFFERIVLEELGRARLELARRGG